MAVLPERTVTSSSRMGREPNGVPARAVKKCGSELAGDSGANAIRSFNRSAIIG